MWVYIVLTDTGTWFTKLIKCFTRSPLNHASISFSKNLKETFSFGRKRANNPFIGGFVKEDLNSKLFRNATCAIYRCHVSAVAFEKMQNAIRQMEDQKQNFKYNFLGLFGVIFNKEIKREKAFFCSQFVATILQNGGVKVNSKPANLIRPCDLAESEVTHQVYAGQLHTYLLKQEMIQPQPQLQDYQINYRNRSPGFHMKSRDQIKSAS